MNGRWTSRMRRRWPEGRRQATVPLAVLCDNSRDAETIPSDLSDFNRYGGLYRHVTLVYVPAISLERVHVEPVLARTARPAVKVRARLHNPTALKDDVELARRSSRSAGQGHSSPQRRNSRRGRARRKSPRSKSPAPQLWSPKSPALYRCVVTLKSPHGEQTVTERFGVRSVEWVEHGPFKLNGERLLLRGTHYHEDHAGVAAAVPDDVVRADAAADQGHGRELRAPRPLPAGAAGAGSVRRTRPARVGGDSVVPRRARRRASTSSNAATCCAT